MGGAKHAGALSQLAQGAVLEACTACGECFRACPMPGPAGIGAADPGAVAGGILAILRNEAAEPASRRWTELCSGSGQCIPACPEGVNPRLMLTLARAALRHADGAEAAHAAGTRVFSSMARAVKAFSRLQLDAAEIARIHPGNAAQAAVEAPELVFYTGCNVIRTPHIALIALDILERLGVRYAVAGGPSACCGVYQMGGGDIEGAGRISGSTIGKLARHGAGEVLAWCPSCQVQLGEVQLPAHALASGLPPPFSLNPYLCYLERRLDVLAPMFVHRVEKRVALSERTGMPAVNAAVKRLLGAVPGIEFVELDTPRAGLMSVQLSTLPAFKTDLLQSELRAAAAAGVTTLATVFHACHRELVPFERDHAFEILNVMEIFAQSMGIRYTDVYKQMSRLADIDAVLASPGGQAAALSMPIAELRETLAADLFPHR